MVNSALYCWKLRNELSGLASWVRSNSAMIPARKNMMSDVTM